MSMALEIVDPVETGDLDALALIVNEHHGHRAAVDVIQHATICGRALLDAKRLVPRGEWGLWLETRTTVSKVTAGRYMRIAQFRAEVPDGITMREAAERLAGHALPDHRLAPTFDVEEARRLRAEGLSYEEIGRRLGKVAKTIRIHLDPAAREHERAYRRALRRGQSGPVVVEAVAPAGDTKIEILLRQIRECQQECAELARLAAVNGGERVVRDGLSQATLDLSRAEQCVHRVVRHSQGYRVTRKEEA